MKKVLFFAAMLMIGVVAYPKSESEIPGHPLFTDAGVVIDGVRWATRNADMLRGFTVNPEDAGRFFQWNRQQCWNAEGRSVNGWDSSIPEGTEWYAENDPCPEGWRVPTYEELQSLKNVPNEWISKNGAYGRLFGTYPYQIFLPVAGSRNSRNSELALETFGYYWSSTQYDETRAMSLWVLSGGVFTAEFNRASGYLVRCVAK